MSPCCPQITNCSSRSALIGALSLLLWTPVVLAQPVNDECENAEGPLSVPSVTAGTTVDSTPDGVGLCETSTTDGGVWYKVIGTGNRMTATTCENQTPPGSADYDSKITVLCSCGLECIGGNDDEPGCNMQSTFSWCTESGVEYFILVHGFLLDPSGAFELSLFDDGVPCGAPTVECDGDDIPAVGVGASTCCSPTGNNAPGCDDQACADLVCTGDPFCCDIEWDFMCSGLAGDQCGDLCNPGVCADGQTANCDDNCPNDANPDQADSDGDGLGDACDFCEGDNATGDNDNDGLCNDIDDTPDGDPDNGNGNGNENGNDNTNGNDNDNVNGNADDDGDGIPDNIDPCLNDSVNDADGDGICDTTQAPVGQQCCGGGLPLVAPALLLLSRNWLRRRARTRR